MKLSIKYCGEWNYLPKAASLADKIKQELNLSTKLIRSRGGVFEVMMNGELIYSKRQTGVFPEESQIISLIKEKK